MKKVLLKKVCPVCLCVYQQRSHNQKFCNDCLEHRPRDVKRYRYEMRKKANQQYNDIYFGQKGIHTVNAEIEQYNKKHGTCYTYGKYIHAKTYGLLEE